MTDDQVPPTSRNIPLPIQREVRQRCGFGCVICGLPLYEYDHILGWANVRRHIADEITLLCDQHHREKGAGLLPNEIIMEASQNPHNLKTGVSKPYNLHYSGSECEIVIGGNTFKTTDSGHGTVLLPVSVDGTPLLAFVLGDGHLLLDLNIFDEFNQPVLLIKNNQLIQSVASWDIKLTGTNLLVREAERKILVDISFEPPHRISINRGRFLKNGVEILIRPNQVIIANNGATFSGIAATNWPAGIVIGPHEKRISAIISLARVSRYRHEQKFVDEWITNEFEKVEPA
jgi:trigger factor